MSVLRGIAAALALAFPMLGVAQPAAFRSADSVIVHEMAAKGMPGVVVVAVDASGVRLRQAWGVANTATRERLTTQHLLQVGSVTKTFTALLALQLAARQRLDLDAPVRRYISGMHASIGALTRFGATLQVRPLGDDRYAIQANERAPVEVFRIRPARGGWPPYIQMFLWAFVRARP